jgi:hypothetical protein
MVWYPRFAAYYSHQCLALRKAIEVGASVATGGDPGVFTHGENALEMQLMHQCGTQQKEVIRAATWITRLCIRGIYWASEEGKKDLEGYMREGKHRWEDKVMLDDDAAVGCITPGFAILLRLIEG